MVGGKKKEGWDRLVNIGIEWAEITLPDRNSKWYTYNLICIGTPIPVTQPKLLKETTITQSLQSFKMA